MALSESVYVEHFVRGRHLPVEAATPKRFGILGCVHGVSCFLRAHDGEPDLTLTTVLFIYDAFVTVDREVTCFWSTKRAATSLLFFSNKYISMTVYVMAMVSVLYEPFPSDQVSLMNRNQVHILV